MLRARALKAGMNPDNALPEDILLMNEDSEGRLEVSQEMETAIHRVRYEQAERERKLHQGGV